MKKVTLLFVVLFAVVFGISAQKGEKSIGLNLNYGTEIESVGLGARFQYNLTDQLRLAPEFTYFFEKDYLSEWDINLNAHYLFPMQDNLKLYPLAGLLITHWSADFDFNFGWASGSFSGSETKVGVNLGGGIQYDINPVLMVNGEIKYCIVSDFDQAVISAGIAYKF